MLFSCFRAPMRNAYAQLLYWHHRLQFQCHPTQSLIPLLILYHSSPLVAYYRTNCHSDANAQWLHRLQQWVIAVVVVMVIPMVLTFFEKQYNSISITGIGGWYPFIYIYYMLYYYADLLYHYVSVLKYIILNNVVFKMCNIYICNNFLYTKMNQLLLIDVSLYKVS